MKNVGPLRHDHAAAPENTEPHRRERSDGPAPDDKRRRIGGDGTLEHGVQGNRRGLHQGRAKRLPRARPRPLPKLVSENERRSHGRVANPGILIGMKVAAANASGRNAQENFAGAGFAGVGDALHPDVTWTMEPRSQDGTGG